MTKKPYVRHYITQSLGALVFFFIVLFFFDLVTAPGVVWAIGATSLASSTFGVFARPHNDTATPLHMIGGYLFAVLTGLICFHLQAILALGLPPHIATEICTALAVAICVLALSLLNFQHPPASGIAMVLVMEPWAYTSIIVILLSLFILSGICWIARPHMRDLYQRA